MAYFEARPLAWKPNALYGYRNADKLSPNLVSSSHSKPDPEEDVRLAPIAVFGIRMAWVGGA